VSAPTDFKNEELVSSSSGMLSLSKRMDEKGHWVDNNIKWMDNKPSWMDDNIKWMDGKPSWMDDNIKWMDRKI